MEEFKETVWDYYVRNRRELPWREAPFDMYRILVSEIMLQQTQASRVIPKYESFLARFPDVTSLAQAPLSDVLREWSGLGYNRRAKYLHDAASSLHTKQNWSVEDLELCKGIGKNTAAAVNVYASNQPLVFIETNIRTIFIHHFFSDADGVDDKEILPFVQESLDIEQPREWYWALMDYGVYLKKSVGNASRQSKHYVKQSKFEGSTRQLRGEVLRRLHLEALTVDELTIVLPDTRLPKILATLESESLIKFSNNQYTLA